MVRDRVIPGVCFVDCVATGQAARFQLHQAQSASPITNRLSVALSQGSSSVTIVTHCRQGTASS